MQNFSSFGPFLEKIGLNSPNNGRQLQPNEARSQNLDKSLFIIGPKEAVSSSGLKKRGTSISTRKHSVLAGVLFSLGRMDP